MLDPNCSRKTLTLQEFVLYSWSGINVSFKIVEFWTTDVLACMMRVQAVYKKLMRESVSLKDLRDLEPQVAKGLEELLTYEGDVESTYCQNFQVPSVFAHLNVLCDVTFFTSASWILSAVGLSRLIPSKRTDKVMFTCRLHMNILVK